MKKNILTIFSVIFSFHFLAQNLTTTFQPDNTNGQDAYVWDYLPDDEAGDQQEISIYGWTYSGTPTIRRVFIKFDLTSIATNSNIVNATLTLYNCSNCSSTSGQHQQLSGSNEMVLKRVVAPWDESTVNWNNQPASTTTGQISIPASISVNQTYQINVTDLVQEMINNPNQSFGFELDLLNENFYRSVIFASSEHSDPSLHPKLEITYNSHGLSLNELDASVNLFPNPNNGNFNLESSFEVELIEVYSIDGKQVTDFTMSKNQKNIEIEVLSKGTYFVRIHLANQVITKKINVE